jgi:hypothetical protein
MLRNDVEVGRERHLNSIVIGNEAKRSEKSFAPRTLRFLRYAAK